MNCSASIVYSNSWLAQTSAIASFGSPSVVYTTTQKGLYRINGAVISSGGCSLDIKSGSLDTGSITPGSSTPSVVWALDTGVGIGFYTTDNPANSYDVFITIEQLQ